MAFDKKAYAAAKKYVKETMKGAGAVKGDKGDPGAIGPQGPEGPKGDKEILVSLAKTLKSLLEQLQQASLLPQLFEKRMASII